MTHLDNFGMFPNCLLFKDTAQENLIVLDLIRQSLWKAVLVEKHYLACMLNEIIWSIIQ